ncbi:MAG: undecaprenyldiphospho-muramoylpentapeptide beta-N-acetylglucosaminyltransferase [Acidobacteria bacterium]|nr:undecaprenyldiphospho-muramoylpentapeptide beta-N-acetylglucosaminyltransferase [Acidobacteriota bacterium]
MNFVMAGGGTGGHVIPALAVGEELRRRGHTVVFVGTSKGMEARLVPRAGFTLRVLRVGALKRVSWTRRLLTAAELPASFMQAAGILEEEQPRAVFSMGGFASGPVTLMAWAKEIPVVVMEPNAMPGFAHRLIGPFTSRALLGFEQAGRFFPHGRWEVTGIPIREEFFRIEPKAHEAPFTVLITGGSQGSHRLNTTAAEAAAVAARTGWLDRLVFLHQSGENEYNDVCSRYQALGARAHVAPFLEDMAGAFARADVVVCRSGASTVAELAAAGKASLLVPFPFAADQHQLRNAEAMQAAGAARVVEDRELSGERLFEEWRAMLDAPARLTEMEAAARRMARPGAAQRAADVLEGL